ncbi:putative ATP-dependent RNA helicase DDX10 [Blattella germanica]|nr:putative ATP-dependent RNA helicase DDX10 [Blattella germanica]
MEKNSKKFKGKKNIFKYNKGRKSKLKSEEEIIRNIKEAYANILEILYCQQWTRLDGVGALVITPTRELAYQIFETLRKVGIYHDVSAGLIIGGKDLQFEKKRMDQCNIVICTPGRLLQHMDENPLFDCSNMKVCIKLVTKLSVRDLARLSLKDPMYVSVHEHAKHSTPESLQQSYVVCELHEKLNMLWSFIRSHLKQKTLVFMSTCKQVKYFYELFCRLRPGTSLMALYGTLHQLRRMSIYESFCRKSNAILFATDIAARGLDFPEVNWVVQLDCPEDANTYIHRAGRTARYQKGGESLLVLMPSEEEAMIEQLEAKKIPIKKIKINPMKLQNPLVKIDGLLARDTNLKESAQRAFVSYAKSVYLMGDKKIFNVNALDFNAYSRSLGLAIPPRIRFLQKVKKQEELRMSKEKKINQTTNDEGSESDVEENVTNDEKNESTQEDEEDRFKDSDSDDDILKIKRKDHALTPEEESAIELLPENVKQKKAVTKVAVARKILKKKIVPNKKTVFNEDGEEKVSTLARKYESEIGGGIDIEVAKQILKEEDIFDKQRFREKVKAERRSSKRKEPQRNSKRKKPRRDSTDEEFSTGLSLKEDEELALHILKNKI